MANTVNKSKNTFTGGLVMDLTPDTTPNEVLTSALNATLVTFNGNELTLQNDMGNGRVETARLPDGYIPIGTCEFGDIIYIVSYNPLTNRSQVGCFPSPERNISSEEAGSTNQLLTTEDFQVLNNNQPTGELKATSVKKILYNNKLNPGDKFVIYDSNQQILNQYNISDIGNDTHTYGAFPKLMKIHVIAIEDSGKINYLDSSVKWYESNPDYFIRLSTGLGVSQPDIDTYRSLLNSGYSVFQSKISGKLALLVELERITGFSATYNVYTEYIKSQGSLTSAMNCGVYWTFNWETENNDINPSHIVLTKSEWTSQIEQNAGKINYIHNDPTGSGNDPYGADLDMKHWESYDLPNPNDENTRRNQLPIAWNSNNSGDYWYYQVKNGDRPENYQNNYSSFLEHNYDSRLKAFIEDIQSDYNLLPTTITIARINQLGNNDHRGWPLLDTYYFNITSSEIEGNTIKYYTSNDVNNEAVPYTPSNGIDDILNNYFHAPIYVHFHDFNGIPIAKDFYSTKDRTLKRTVKYDLSNLIYHYILTPAMPYGLLEDLSVEGFIDFSKINSGSVELKTWKYFNGANASTLTLGLEAYMEENKGISEVTLEFYDNQGFAAAYHIANKESYSGQFTEVIPLNGLASNYKLNNIDHAGVSHTHKGVEIDDQEMGDNKTIIIDEGSDEQSTADDKYYLNDCGTIYANSVYLVKIFVNKCAKNALGDLDLTTIEPIVFYRWMWTNTLFNDYYYSTRDFDTLYFSLDFDILATFSSTSAYKHTIIPKYQSEDTSESLTTNISNHLGATVQVIGAQNFNSITQTDDSGNGGEEGGQGGQQDPQYDPQQDEPIDETEITTSYTVIQGQNKVRSLAVDITREVTNFSDSAFTVIVTTNGTTTILNGSQGAFLLGTEGTKVVLQNFNPEIPMENTEVEIQIASGGITYGNNLSNTNPINVTFSSFHQ